MTLWVILIMYFQLLWSSDIREAVCIINFCGVHPPLQAWSGAGETYFLRLTQTFEIKSSSTSPYARMSHIQIMKLQQIARLRNGTKFTPRGRVSTASVNHGCGGSHWATHESILNAQSFSLTKYIYIYIYTHTHTHTYIYIYIIYLFTIWISNQNLHSIPQIRSIGQFLLSRSVFFS
jgi:hypothetical protein